MPTMVVRTPSGRIVGWSYLGGGVTPLLAERVSQNTPTAFKGGYRCLSLSLERGLVLPGSILGRVYYRRLERWSLSREKSCFLRLRVGESTSTRTYIGVCHLSLGRRVAHEMFEVSHIPLAKQHDGCLIEPNQMSLFSFCSWVLGVLCLVDLDGTGRY